MIQGIYRIGIQADDPAQLAAFYRDVLDMQVVGGSQEDSPFGASAFPSCRPEAESHHLAVFRDDVCAHGVQGRLARRTAGGVPPGGRARSADQVGGQSRSLVRVLLRRSGGQHDRGVLADRQGMAPAALEPIDLSLPEEELLQETERFPALARSASRATHRSHLDQ